jgi:hypothetical protein
MLRQGLASSFWPSARRPIDSRRRDRILVFEVVVKHAPSGEGHFVHGLNLLCPDLWRWVAGVGSDHAKKHSARRFVAFFSSGRKAGQLEHSSGLKVEGLEKLVAHIPSLRSM